MTATKPTAAQTRDDALRAAVADLPKLPWLAADFVAADCRFGHDYDGDPAVWVRLIAKDEAIERPGFFDEMIPIRHRIRDLLQDADLLDDKWGFFDLDTVSERREMLREDGE